MSLSASGCHRRLESSGYRIVACRARSRGSYKAHPNASSWRPQEQDLGVAEGQTFT